MRPILLATLFALAFGSVQSQALTILLTSDDGWDARGTQAMKAALVAHGHHVTLVGSLTGQSGSSAALNFEPLELVKQNSSDGALEYSLALADGVTGAEPATCAAVGMGLVEAATGAAQDLVVSGINAGQNLGAAALVSGTVGAATAATSTMLGGRQVPAIAISTDEVCDEGDPEAASDCAQQNQAQYQRVANWTAGFIQALEHSAWHGVLMPAGIGLNINHPLTEDIRGALLARQGRTFTSGGLALSLTFGCYADDCVNVPDGTALPAGQSGAAFIELPDFRNADTTLNAMGYITVVPTFGDLGAGDPPSQPARVAYFEKKLRWILRELSRGAQ